MRRRATSSLAGEREYAFKHALTPRGRLRAHSRSGGGRGCTRRSRIGSNRRAAARRARARCSPTISAPRPRPAVRDLAWGADTAAGRRGARPRRALAGPGRRAGDPVATSCRLRRSRCSRRRWHSSATGRGAASCGARSPGGAGSSSTPTATARRPRRRWRCEPPAVGRRRGARRARLRRLAAVAVAASRLTAERGRALDRARAGASPRPGSRGRGLGADRPHDGRAAGPSPARPTRRSRSPRLSATRLCWRARTWRGSTSRARQPADSARRCAGSSARSRSRAR